MSNKLFLALISLSVVVVTAWLTLRLNGPQTRALPKNEIDTAVNQAKHLYNQQKALGEDFSNGPCLSNALLPGWVLDIVHSPRQPVDNLPANQCSAYLEGRATHFVELDTEGNLVRAQ